MPTSEHQDFTHLENHELSNSQIESEQLTLTNRIGQPRHIIDYVNLFPFKEDEFAHTGSLKHESAWQYPMQNEKFDEIANTSIIANMIKGKLKQHYTKYTKLPFLLFPKRSIPIEEIFTRLSIAPEQTQQQKTLNEHNNEKYIRPNQLFDGLEDDNGVFKNKKLLILGRPGIGKSTLSQYLETQANQLWKDQFDYVFRIKLRDLLVTMSLKPKKLVDDHIVGEVIRWLLQLQDRNPTTEELTYFLSEQRHKVLWILDGFDEVEDFLSKPTKLKNFLLTIFDNYNVILTSRMATIRIGGDVVEFDRKFENLGFTDNDIEYYISQFMQQVHDHEALSQALLVYLKRYPSLREMVHVPINLELVCCIWQKKQQEPTTLTELYSEVSDMLWSCYEEKLKEKGKELHFGIKSALEKLAYKAMLKNQYILTAAMLKDAATDAKGWYNRDLHKAILASGFLKTSDDDSFQLNKNAEFIHPTFQEFLAAACMADLLEKERLGKNQGDNLAVLRDNKYKPFYQNTWTFTAGILYERGKEKSDFLGLENFWHNIEAKPIDLVGMAHYILVIHALEECKADESLPVHAAYVRTIADLLSNDKIYSYDNLIIRTLCASWKVLNKEVYLKILIEKIDKLTIDEANITSFINLLSGMNDFTAIVYQYLIILIKKAIMLDYTIHSDLLDKVLKAIKLLQVNSPLLEALLQMLVNDNDALISTEALIILHGLKLKASNSSLSLPIKYLNDKNPNIRDYGKKILVKLEEKDPGLVIFLVREYLNDEKLFISYKILKALVELKKNEPDILLHLIKDNLKNDYFLSVALKVLVKLENADPDFVFNLIKESLDGENIFVVANAFSAFAKLKQLDPKLGWKLLLTYLNSDNIFYRTEALKSLVKFKKTDPKLLLSLLLKTLQDPDERFRNFSLELLAELWRSRFKLSFDYWKEVVENSNGKMKAKLLKMAYKFMEAEPESVLKLLENTLSDKQDEVRVSAIIGLTKLKSYKVLGLFEKILQNDDSILVKNAVLHALPQFEQTNPKIVLHLLSAAVSDEEGFIRAAAFSSLSILKKADKKTVLNLLKNGLTDSVFYNKHDTLTRFSNWNHQIDNELIQSLLKIAIDEESMYYKDLVLSVLNKLGKNNPKYVSKALWKYFAKKQHLEFGSSVFMNAEVLPANNFLSDSLNLQKTFKAWLYFTGRNGAPYHIDLRKYYSWYDTEALSYLVYSQLNSRILNFITTLNNYTFTLFCEELEHVFTICSSLNKPVGFIVIEPGTENPCHFIAGFLSIDHELLLVNLNGLTRTEAFYNELKNIHNKMRFKAIYLASNITHENEQALIACGPICVELLRGWQQSPPDFLQLSQTKQIKYNFEFFETTILLPESLERLKQEDFKESIIKIREQHAELIKGDNPIESVSKDKDFWFVTCNNAPIKVLVKGFFRDKYTFNFRESEEYKQLIRIATAFSTTNSILGNNALIKNTSLSIHKTLGQQKNLGSHNELKSTIELALKGLASTSLSGAYYLLDVSKDKEVINVFAEGLMENIWKSSLPIAVTLNGMKLTIHEGFKETKIVALSKELQDVIKKLLWSQAKNLGLLLMSYQEPMEEYPVPVPMYRQEVKLTEQNWQLTVIRNNPNESEQESILLAGLVEGRLKIWQASINAEQTLQLWSIPESLLDKVLQGKVTASVIVTSKMDNVLKYLRQAVKNKDAIYDLRSYLQKIFGGMQQAKAKELMLETIYFPKFLSYKMQKDINQSKHKLDLSYRGIEDNDLLNTILKNINEREDIEILCLSHNKITHKGLNALLEACNEITKFKQLKQLFLNNNRIFFDADYTNELIKRLSKISLDNLDLSMNFIARGELPKVKNNGKDYKLYGEKDWPIEQFDNKHEQAHKKNYTNVFQKDLKINSLYLAPVTSWLNPADKSRFITSEQGIVWLLANNKGLLAEHAFLLIEGICSYGQRYIIKADLYRKGNSAEIILRYVEPNEYYDLMGDNPVKYYHKSAVVTKKQLIALKQALCKSRNEQQFIRYAEVPTGKNTHNCITWLMEMLSIAGIIKDKEVNSSLPSAEVGNQDSLQALTHSLTYSIWNIFKQEPIKPSKNQLTEQEYRDRKVIIYIWRSWTNPKTSAITKDVGHVAITIPTKNLYISLWPEFMFESPTNLAKTDILQAILGQTPLKARFIKDYKEEINKQGKDEDIKFQFYSLDTDAIERTYLKIKQAYEQYDSCQEKQGYTLLGLSENGNSCASLAALLLKAGGIEQLTDGERKADSQRTSVLLEQSLFSSSYEKRTTRGSTQGSSNASLYGTEMVCGILGVKSPDTLEHELKRYQALEKKIHPLTERLVVENIPNTKSQAVDSMAQSYQLTKVQSTSSSNLLLMGQSTSLAGLCLVGGSLIMLAISVGPIVSLLTLGIGLSLITVGIIAMNVATLSATIKINEPIQSLKKPASISAQTLSPMLGSQHKMNEQQQKPQDNSSFIVNGHMFKGIEKESRRAEPSLTRFQAMKPLTPKDIGMRPKL